MDHLTNQPSGGTSLDFGWDILGVPEESERRKFVPRSI